MIIVPRYVAAERVHVASEQREKIRLCRLQTHNFEEGD